MAESAQYDEIRLALCKTGARVFRNNVGLFRTDRGTKIRTGLCVGSSDLIGWTSDGRFLAVEVKQLGRSPTPEQAAFLAAVNKAGGIGFVAYGPVDAIAKLLEVENGLRGNQ